MTSWERVNRAIEFSGPDRLPLSHGILPGAVDNLGDGLRLLFKEFPSDFEGQTGEYRGTEDNPHFSKGEETDDWGCTWVNPGLGTEGQVKGHPIADWAALDSYKPPDPYAGEWPPAKKRDQYDKYVIWSGGGHRLFERMHFLRGYDKLLLDIAEDRPEVQALRDLVLDHTLKRLERQLEYDIDAVSYMDDWGAQDRLMIKPQDWRRIFKPAYKKIVDLAHQAGKHCHFHTDGYTMEILDDLIEVGFDVINPQFSCMVLAAVAAKCAGRVCIRSDIDRQYLLPYGTPEEIRENVRQVVELFHAPDGGLIGHGEIGPDVPLANARAMLSTFAEFGAW